MNKVLVVIIIGLLILGSLLAVGFLKNRENTSSYTVEADSEKCDAPDGVDADSWDEHMSHHPDIYGDCF